MVLVEYKSKGGESHVLRPETVPWHVECVSNLIKLVHQKSGLGTDRDGKLSQA